MLARIRALIDRWQQLKTLDALTDRDLADLGMTRGQVEAFIRMPPDVPDRVARMASIFGITDSDLKANHAAYLELLGTCAQCRDRGACSLVLARGDVARPSEAAFCPNARLFGRQGSVAA
ncbi:MAG: DUF1127 domain-containing protein [Rhodobacteraceae bacterium]|nr:DUF1127 domain-containing protein [Paracoccaceae bacterium]